MRSSFNVTSIHSPTTTEVLVHFPAVPSADLAHSLGVSTLPSYPAGVVQDDASPEPSVYIVQHILAPYVGVPNSHHYRLDTAMLSKHIMYFYIRPEVFMTVIMKNAIF
jgi:hypothetical protein